jgi:hypothetical protein
VLTELASPSEFALITQMRAGTHFVCAILRIGIEATLYRPTDGLRYAPMDDEYILRGLQQPLRLPQSRSGPRVYFSHYYHPHHQSLARVPAMYLIGFPFDSFYSDGIVYTDRVRANDPSPSATRRHARGYVLRFDSEEWQFLELRMRQNAGWLNEIADGANNLVIRYEDFFSDFDGTTARLSQFVGGFSAPLPRPVWNRRRSYWTERYEDGFDRQALGALWEMFAPAIGRWYPERLRSLRAAVGRR